MRLSEFNEGAEITRDGDFATLGYVDSGVQGTLVFCDVVSYLERARQNTNVSCVITTQDLAQQALSKWGVAISPRPRIAFYRIHNRMQREGLYPGFGFEYGIGAGCSIHSSAIIGDRVRIGANTIVDERVVIKDYTFIGDGCHIHAGAVIGCDGILHMDEGNGIQTIPHAGGVLIGNGVGILANAVVVRSIHYSPLTEVGDHSIVGIASNIGHEARVGCNCVISANCVIARRARISDGAWIGTSSMIREHITIGRSARVMAGSIVVKDVADLQSVSGNFAVEHRRNLLEYARRLRS